jgi:hypothetical protein
MGRGVEGHVDPLGMVLGLPGALGVLLGGAVVMAGLHLLVNWVFRPGGSVRDRLGALVLVVGAALVPVATLGYVRTEWHEELLVRVAEGAFGLALLGITVAFVVGSRRRRGGDERVPTEPAYYVSTGPDSSIPAPAYDTRAVSSERVQGALLLLVVAGSGVAYVAHALDLFSYSWA